MNFLDPPETFQTIQKLSRLTSNFQDHMEIFQTIGKLSTAHFDQFRLICCEFMHFSMYFYRPR